MSAYTLNVSLDRLVCGHVGARLMALCKSGCAHVQCCGLWADCALCTVHCRVPYALCSQQYCKLCKQDHSIVLSKYQTSRLNNPQHC